MDSINTLKKNSFIIKKIFFLKKIKNWTGGWSYGKKVFWGRVGSLSKTKLRVFRLNNYNIINSIGFIQYFFFSQFNKKLLSLLFYPKLGILALNQKESTQKIGSKTILNISSPNILKLKNGVSNLIKFLPVGSIIHTIKLKNSKKIGFVKSPGSFAKIIQHSLKFSLLQLPSKSYYFIPNSSISTLGIVASNKKFMYYKAGQKRWQGCTPKVWGIAMNPVDHPHGGRTNGGKHPRTPNGFLTKGVKTRRKKKWSNHRFY